MNWTFAEAFADPHARHAITIHLPIVFIPAAAAVLLAHLGTLVATKHRNPVLPLVALAMLLIAAAGAGLAAGSGEEAIDLVERDAAPLTQAELDALEHHESLGEGAWMWPTGVALLTALTLIPAGKRKWLPPAATALALAGALAATTWAALTAHAGGAIVYQHGLGVPDRTQGPAATSFEQSGDHEQDHDHDD